MSADRVTRSQTSLLAKLKPDMRIPQSIFYVSPDKLYFQAIKKLEAIKF